jgi:diguanylate cyclase (GGDEF)-like protein
MLESVLIADDDPLSRRLLQVSLNQWGYSVTVATDGAEALRALDEPDGPQLAVLDWMMPRFDGIEVCRTIRTSSRERYVYIVLLTARGYRDDIVQGLEAGADDYITKPFHLHELKARLRTGSRILTLQEELITARERLRIQATFDSVTGLFNRVAIQDALARELVRSRREDKPVAVLMADLDHFKHVNDTYGHPVGDVVLRVTADRMRGLFRSYDSIGRYGGEEFLVVLSGCDLATGIEQAERMRKAIYTQGVSVANTTIPVSISIGVAATTHDGRESTDLLLAADKALYAAKRAGRNRVEANLQLTPQDLCAPKGISSGCP